MPSKAFLLEMCMGCLKSDCEINETKTNKNTDYIHLVNVCFPELQVKSQFIYFFLFLLLSLNKCYNHIRYNYVLERISKHLQIYRY